MPTLYAAVMLRQITASILTPLAMRVPGNLLCGVEPAPAHGRAAGSALVPLTTPTLGASVVREPSTALASTNDIRARLRALPDTAKRAHAVSRAHAWADILRHMDRTAEPEFCGCPTTAPRPPSRAPFGPPGTGSHG
jgi:hypothetical protein